MARSKGSSFLPSTCSDNRFLLTIWPGLRSADPSAELVVTTDAAFEVPTGAQFEVPAGAQFEVPAGTKVPNYDRATPPGPHADDQTSTFAVLDPDEAQATD